LNVACGLQRQEEEEKRERRTSEGEAQAKRLEKANEANKERQKLRGQMG
jgi:hypothetical protein